MNKSKQARRYYEELESLCGSNSEIPKILSQKVKKINKDQFIKEYPLSALQVTNYRTFWEICLDLGMVSKPFNSEYEDFTPFERKLHEIILSIMCLKDESQYSKDDIIRLFEKYKYCS